MSFPLVLLHNVGKKCLILREMDSCQWGVAADSCSEEHYRGESTNITHQHTLPTAAGSSTDQPAAYKCIYYSSCHACGVNLSHLCDENLSGGELGVTVHISLSAHMCHH